MIGINSKILSLEKLSGRVEVIIEGFPRPIVFSMSRYNKMQIDKIAEWYESKMLEQKGAA